MPDLADYGAKQARQLLVDRVSVLEQALQQHTQALTEAGERIAQLEMTLKSISQEVGR